MGMTNSLYTLILLFLIVTPIYINAAEIPVKYTQENIQTALHDKPVSFEMDKDGNFSGITETGKLFTQTYVSTSIFVRLQKFTIDEAYFYVSSKGVIFANSDIEALSVYLSNFSTDLTEFEQA